MSVQDVNRFASFACVTLGRNERLNVDDSLSVKKMEKEGRETKAASHAWMHRNGSYR